MNIFDAFLNKSKSNLIGTQPMPSVPTMVAPTAPRTASYVPPTQTQVLKPTAKPTIKPKANPTFFSDEKTAFDRMMADNVPEADAIEAIKSRRNDLLGSDNKITAFEAEALKKMQADGLSAKEATAALIEHRKSMQDEAKKQYDSMGTGEKIAK